MFGTHAITSPTVVDSTSLQEDCNTEVVKAATKVSSPSRHINTVPLADEFPQAASLLQTPSTHTDYAKPVVHSENKDAYAKIYEAVASTVAGRLAVQPQLRSPVMTFGPGADP